MIAFDAIVLAGGRSSRMGDVDKVGILLDDRPLLAHVCDAVVEARTLVVVGPDALAGAPERAIVAREDPAFGGPAAAIGAGLDAVRDPAELVVVVAADMPRAAAALGALLAAAATGGDGVVARQSDGRRQPLLAVYRTASLRSAVDAHSPLSGTAVHRLIGDLDLAELPLPDDVVADVDTPADLHRLTASDKEQHDE